MTHLREAVMDKHRAAEETDLAKAMISGDMTEELYHQFVFNMKEVYAAIERRLPFLPDGIKRTQRYLDDLNELGRGSGTPMPSTVEYVRYMGAIEIPDVWAHVYVHYLGNMYGGQMLKKNMKWKASHLEFDDVKGSIGYVRANIADVRPEEANRAFEWTIRIYDELYRDFGRHSEAA